MNENKRNEAKELIKKGKWNLAVALIAKETGLPEDEAKKVATQIKEEWLAERAAEPAPETKKKGVGGKIIVVLFLLAVFGGGGWFAYNHFVVEPAQYAIEEDDANVETEVVGNCNSNEDKNVFDCINNVDGNFFINDDADGKLYRMSRDSFDEEVINSNETANKVSSSAAKSVKKLINSGFYDYVLDSDTSGAGIPENLIIDGQKYQNAVGLSYDGIECDDDMYEYFKKRNLDLSCGEISVEKVVAALKMGNGGTAEFYVVLNTEIKTNGCDENGIFAPQGETQKMKIAVSGYCLKNCPFSIDTLYFE